jgi:hypothetical protein
VACSAYSTCAAVPRISNPGTSESLRLPRPLARYVVVPEVPPLRYWSSSLIRSELAPYYAFHWLPASRSYMHVMRTSTRNTVASVEGPAFMAIHYINAYEEEGKDDSGATASVDCCEHYGDGEDRLSSRTRTASSSSTCRGRRRHRSYVSGSLPPWTMKALPSIGRKLFVRTRKFFFVFGCKFSCFLKYYLGSINLAGLHYISKAFFLCFGSMNSSLDEAGAVLISRLAKQLIR